MGHPLAGVGLKTEYLAGQLQPTACRVQKQPVEPQPCTPVTSETSRRNNINNGPTESCEGLRNIQAALQLKMFQGGKGLQHTPRVQHLSEKPAKVHWVQSKPASTFKS